MQSPLIFSQTFTDIYIVHTIFEMPDKWKERRNYTFQVTFEIANYVKTNFSGKYKVQKIFHLKN